MPKPKSNEPNLNELSKFQKFAVQRIPRAEIKNAEYNPRKIQEKSRAKLKAKMKDVGLVETLVWNQRTGNLVSGHQRIGILDELERGTNYSLDVSVIDVDEKTEKELNVFLNNPSAQGQWNLDILSDLIQQSCLNVEDLGFDLVDAAFLMPGSELTKDTPTTEKMTSDIQELKDAKKRYREGYRLKDGVDFFLVLVFQSGKEADAFLEKCKLPANQQYVDGSRLMANLGLKQEQS